MALIRQSFYDIKKEGLQKMSDQEVNDLYKKAYEEGYRKSSSTSHSEKKRDARGYARERLEELGVKPDWTALASGVSSMVMGLKKEFFPNGHSNGNSKESTLQAPLLPQDTKSNGQQGKSPRAIVEEWISKNDWIASDKLIAHFLGITPNHVSTVRSQLKFSKGYSFERVEYQGADFWKVTDRPADPREKEIEALKAQMRELYIKLETLK